MREFHRFDRAFFAEKGHMPLAVKVSLEVLTKEDDEWATEEDAQIYDDGVHASGELETDIWFGNNKIKPGLVGDLTVHFEDEYSRFNIVIIEMISVETIIPNKQKRYWWGFHLVGKPLHDGLELFPFNFKKTPMKVFTVTNFVGHWPIGVAAVVVADDRKKARKLLDAALDKKNLMVKQEKKYDLDELDICSPQALVLCDGNY